MGATDPRLFAELPTLLAVNFFCHHAGCLIQHLCQMSIVQNSGGFFVMYGVILPNYIGLKIAPSERSLLTRSFSRGFFLTNAQISMLRKSNTLGVDYFISKGGQATFEWPLKDVSSVRVECIRRLGMSCFTFKLQLGDRGVMEASLHDNNNILHDTALPAITIFQWKLESLQNHPFIFKGPRLIFHWTCQPRRPIIDRMESLCWMHCLWTIGAFRVHPKVSAGVALSSRLTGGWWQYLESPIGFLGANQSYPTKFWLAHLIYLKKVDTFKNFRLESQDVLEKPRCETQPFKWDSVM